MALRDFVLRRCWNNTCGHNAPFWPGRGNADKEGNRMLRWECQECRNGRNENVHISWLDRLENRLKNLERSGSNDREGSQVQRATGFQRKRLGAETAARFKSDPILTTVLLMRRAKKTERNGNARTSWLDRFGNRLRDLGQSGSNDRGGPQAQQATRLQYARVGVDETAAAFRFDPIPTGALFLRRVETIEQKRIAEDHERTKAEKRAARERCRQAREAYWAHNNRLARSVDTDERVGRVTSGRGVVHTIPDGLEELEQERQVVRRRK